MTEHANTSTLHSVIVNAVIEKDGKILISQRSFEIKDFESKGNNWLEQMKEMILSASQAKILITKNNPYEFRSFLKNIGSNFVLKDKNFGFQGNIGWRILLNSPAFPNWRRRGDSNP